MDASIEGLDAQTIANGLVALDANATIDVITAVMKARPEIAPAIVSFAVPDLTYPPIKAIMERRATGRIKQVDVEKGFGFVESPELHAIFNTDVFVHCKQLHGITAGSIVNFAVMLSRDNRPQAVDVQLAPGQQQPPQNSQQSQQAPPPAVPENKNGTITFSGAGGLLKIKPRQSVRSGPYDEDDAPGKGSAGTGKTLNWSTGWSDRPSSGKGAGMGTTMGSGMGLGMNAGMGLGMSADMNSGMGAGMGNGMGLGMIADMNAGMGTGMGACTGDMQAAIGNGMGTTVGVGMGDATGFAMGSSMASGQGAGMEALMAQSMGEGTIPGMGLGMEAILGQAMAAGIDPSMVPGLGLGLDLGMGAVIGGGIDASMGHAMGAGLLNLAALPVPGPPPGPGPPGPGEKGGTRGFKRRLCTYFEQTGTCKDGSGCNFAHGQAEIQGQPSGPRLKSRLCTFFEAGTACPRNDTCSFAHGEHEIGTMAAPGGPSSGAPNPMPSLMSLGGGKEVEMHCGIVKSFSEKNGWGFIASDTVNGDVYFKGSFLGLGQGATVQFGLNWSPDGKPRAHSLSLAQPAPPAAFANSSVPAAFAQSTPPVIA